MSLRILERLIPEWVDNIRMAEMDQWMEKCETMTLPS